MKRFISAAVLIIVLCVPALGLSDAEYLRMKRNPDSGFDDADKELNRAYKQAEQYMTKSEFEKLKREQRQWLADGRDKDAQRIMREENEPKEWAYTYATLKRAQEIYSITPSESAEINAHDFIGVYYNDNDLRLTIYWADEQSELMNVNFSVPRLSVELQGYADGKVLKAECDEESEKLAKYEFGIDEEKNVDFSAALTMLNKDKIRVKAASDLDGLFESASGIFVRREH